MMLLILVSPDYKIENLFPMFDRGVMPVIKGTIVPAGWYSEFFLVIFLFSFSTDRKKGKKYGIITVFAVMLILVFVNLIACRHGDLGLRGICQNLDVLLCVCCKYGTIAESFGLQTHRMAVRDFDR